MGVKVEAKASAKQPSQHRDQREPTERSTQMPGSNPHLALIDLPLHAGGHRFDPGRVHRSDRQYLRAI
jgi:hypothetical protein